MFKKRCCKNVYIHFKVCALSQKKGDLDIKRRDSQIINRPLVEWNNLEPADLLGDLELADLLGDLEFRRSGDLDLFDAGDASLAFRAGDRSLDL